MAQNSFELEVLINAPYAKVLTFVQTPIKMIALNPLVIEAHEQTANLYAIQDRLKVLGMTFKVNYTAHFTMKPMGYEVETTASGTRTHSTLTCATQGAHTLVHEYTHFTALWGMTRYVHTTANTAHRELLARLKNKLETLETQIK